jgi:hypothetical protein
MIAWIPLLWVSAVQTDHPYRSAVIIGVNEPFERSQPVLRYADDDAARFFEILSPELDEVELLTVLDAESQKLFPDAARVARSPDKPTLLGALERLGKRAKAAREAGRRAELYFIYTGHGRVEGGEGEVKLAGGSLNRTELAEHVLSSRLHDRTHLIIDACNAYHLVNARGPEPAAVTQAFDGAFERFVRDQSLDRFPTVGVVLSTSGAGATHEWSRFLGGVFSHEIRSGLAGAADADGDGRVDYAEMEAFVAAANVAVPQLKGRPRVFVRAPAIDANAPLIDLDPRMPVLELPPDLEGHYYVEDDRGIRYAELNKAPGFVVSLHLVPRAGYELKTGEGAELARFDEPRGVVTVSLPLKAPMVEHAERGDDEPPNIFAEPFGPRFLVGFRAQLEGRILADSSLSTQLAPDGGGSTTLYAGAIGGIAAAALGTVGSIWQAQRASRDYHRYADAYNAADETHWATEFQAERNRALALGVGAGIAAAIAALCIYAAMD